MFWRAQKSPGTLFVNKSKTNKTVKYKAGSDFGRNKSLLGGGWEKRETGDSFEER